MLYKVSDSFQCIVSMAEAVNRNNTENREHFHGTRFSISYANIKILRKKKSMPKNALEAAKCIMKIMRSTYT